MKSIRNILILSVVTLSIIMFWLVPRINSAKNVEYVRRYEDTDRRSATAERVDTLDHELFRKAPAAQKKPLHAKKVYKEERIRVKDKWSEITPEKFSRAAHFEEKMPPKALLDQLGDTTKINQ